MAGYPTDLPKAAGPLSKWCTPAVVEAQVSAAERVELERYPLLEWRAPPLEEVQVSAAERVKLERLADLVAEIVVELKKGGPLKKPFERAWPDEYVARAINAIRRRRSQSWPPNVPQPPSVAQYRKAEKVAREMGRTAYFEVGTKDDTHLVALRDVVQEPPPRANKLKHSCAAEAFFLMEMFSAKPPTFTEGGLFQIVAQKLYEAVTGRSDVDLARACDWILRERRKYRQHD
jgi:hypothetical protein